MLNIMSFIRKNEFYINIWKNKINIVNFDKIVILENNKVVINAPDGKITIKGENLSINKLLEKEILLSGNIFSVELGDYSV